MRAAPDLPDALAGLIGTALEGVSGRALAEAVERLSRAYRGGAASAAAIRADIDVLAYLVARMPATYAAAVAAFSRVAEARPDFTPRSLIDLGAGPGTASHAAVAVWPSIAEVVMVEPHAGLAARARFLAGADVRLEGCRFVASPAGIKHADLVVAGYVLAELDVGQAAVFAGRMLALARETVVIVEPGTPDGFARVRAARAGLIAEAARVVAPCPHEGACPLATPDWCHFSVRLARRRAHRLAKGADAPFEDERFSYVAASRLSAPDARPARIIAAPMVTKESVTMRLCTAEGIAHATIPRRDKAGYKAGKKHAWGDVFDA